MHLRIPYYVIKRMRSFLDLYFIFGANYLFLAIIAIACIYFLSQPSTIQKRIIIFSIITLPLAYIVAKILSMFYYDARPFVVGNFIPLIPHAPDNGFPSDHTLISAAFAAVLFPFNKKVAIITSVITLIVGYSRVYTGVHHSIDVIGSIAIVGVVACVVYFFIKNSKYFKQ